MARKSKNSLDKSQQNGANGRRGVPEKMLWCEVLALAIRDLISTRGVLKDDAMHFIYNRRRWFNDVCDMAGLEPDYVLRIIEQAQSHPDKVRLVYEMSKNMGKGKRVISDAFRASSGRKRFLRIVAGSK